MKIEVEIHGGKFGETAMRVIQAALKGQMGSTPWSLTVDVFDGAGHIGAQLTHTNDGARR